MSTGATLLADVRLADGRNADIRMAKGVIDVLARSARASTRPEPR